MNKLRQWEVKCCEEKCVGKTGMEAKASVKEVDYLEKTVFFHCFTRFYFYLESKHVVFAFNCKNGITFLKSADLVKGRFRCKVCFLLFPCPSLCDVLEQMCHLSSENLQVLIQSTTSEMEKS